MTDTWSDVCNVMNTSADNLMFKINLLTFC